MCGVIAFFTDTQLEPIFSTRLTDFKMTTFQVGLLFTVIPCTYIPSMLLVQYMPKWVEKRVTLICASVFLGLATFLNGPSKLLDMKDSLALIIAGQAFSGIFIAFLTIPALPEMISAATKSLNGGHPMSESDQ